MTALMVVSLVLLGGIGLYLVLVYVAWAIVWRTRRDPRLVARWWRAVPLEIVAILLLTALGIPTVRRRFKKLRKGRDGGVPVLCVHGYTQNFGNFALLARKLERAGAGPIYGVNIRGWRGPVELGAAQVARAVKRVVEETGARQVDIVGHSMGGLVVRAALARHEVSDHVRRVVTLGTPHAGSILASYGVGATVRDMRCNSTFLAGLPPPPVTMTAIWSTADAMVLPVRNAAVGERDVIFDDIGHLSLLLSPRVAEAVARALTAPDRTPDVTDAGSATGTLPLSSAFPVTTTT